MSEITKTNKIKQELKVVLTAGTQEFDKFMSTFTAFVEEESQQTVEGQIHRISICSSTNYDSDVIRDVDICISTLKEDKLKLLTAGAIEAKASVVDEVKPL